MEIMKTEIIKKIDKLGRIVLPIEMRKMFGWDMRSQISIERQEDGILLRTHQSCCFACGSEGKLTKINGKFICSVCIHELNQKNNQNPPA